VGRYPLWHGSPSPTPQPYPLGATPCPPSRYPPAPHGITPRIYPAKKLLPALPYMRHAPHFAPLLGVLILPAPLSPRSVAPRPPFILNTRSVCMVAES
jgi:hypothetical protein